jgi:integrase
MLAEIPEAERAGRLFPWRTRSGVYRWLRPLARGLCVTFTPHMGRHSVGTWLNAERAGLRTIMEALHHRDPASSIRYQSADVEIVRAATSGFARITGEPKASKRGAA